MGLPEANENAEDIFHSRQQQQQQHQQHLCTPQHIFSFNQFHVKKETKFISNFLFQNPNKKSVDVYNHVSSSYLYGNYVFAIVKKTPLYHTYMYLYILYIYTTYIYNSFVF